MRSNDINPIIPQINPDFVPPISVNPKKTKIIPINLVIGIIVGVILTVSTASAFYFYQASKKLAVNIQTNLVTPTPNKEPTVKPTEVSSPYKITWLNKPQKISYIPIFKANVTSSEEGLHFDKTEFYLVANLGDGSQLINLFVPTEGMGGFYTLYRIIKSVDGKFFIVEQKDKNNNNIEYFTKYLIDGISVSSLSFKDLEPPESIVENNTNFIKLSTNNFTFDVLTNPKLIKSTEYGDLYVIYSNQNITDVQDKTYYLKLKDSTLFNYKPRYNFLSDDNAVWIKWNDNSKVSDQFNDHVSGIGCGGVSGASVIRDGSSLLNDKVAVGTYDQKTIYQIKNINNLFLKKLYEDYKKTSQFITPAAVPNIEEFTNQKNHFLYQDFSGDWVVFANQKYSIQAECGKPVIYLYPSKETKINVQVGAKITKSEPTYPQNGWTVTAKPNGELTYQNQVYPYLFWEGLGNGIYPNYKNRGTVVAQKDLVSTVYKQLSQLGLNQKESADFMEFWQSKLPTTPYVRLTWLNTADMDILAPLSINPNPDTKIRIFLEFEALNEKIKLIPQTLSAPKRNGFTLIEWGGLLLK